MKERPTPETDAFFRSFADGDATPSHAEYYDRMTQLERERDEALEDGLKQARLLGMSGSREARLIAERDEARSEVQRIQHWTTVNGVSDLERERDNALSDLKQAEVDTLRALHERNEAREQRDRLAEALRRIIEDMPTIAGSGWVCMKQAKAALAAVEGGEP